MLYLRNPRNPRPKKSPSKSYLKAQPQRELNNSRIGSCRNLAERSARNTLTRVSEFGQVEQIKELRPELGSNAFADFGPLLNAQIKAVSRRTSKRISAERPIAALRGI